MKRLKQMSKDLIKKCLCTLSELNPHKALECKCRLLLNMKCSIISPICVISPLV